MNPEPDPRFRRLLAPVLISGALLALAWMSWRVIRAVEPLPVFHLSDGSVVRVEGLAWDGHPLRREPELWTRLKRALPPALRQWVGAPRDPIRQDYGGLTWLFTQIAPPTNGAASSGRPRVEHLNAAGQSLLAVERFRFGGGPGEHLWHFPSVWWREDRLRFRLKDGPRWHDFSVPNPRRGEVFPHWEPEAVPAVRTIGDIEVVCTGLHPFPAFEPFEQSFPAWWRPRFEGRHAGTSGADWFWWDAQMRDPLGSLMAVTPGETVVKVLLRAIPQAQIPERMGRVRHRWKVRVPDPLELIELEIPAALAQEGLHNLWISGAGKFRFRAESVRSLGPLSEEETGNAAGSFMQCELDGGFPEDFTYRSLLPTVWWRGVRPTQLPEDAGGNREDGHWVMQFLPAEGDPPVESTTVTGGSPIYQAFWDQKLAWQVQGDSLPKIGSRRSLVIQLLEAPILKTEFTLPVPTALPPTLPR
jgi:hypothetical protein